MIENEGLYKSPVEMININDPRIVGVPLTPAFLKVLSFQFTPEETQLALDLKISPW